MSDTSQRLAGRLLLIVACGAALVAAPGREPPRAGASRQDRPNIVIFLTDDLGYGDLASYGHPTIRTPNLDRMAAEGIRLTSFYAAASVCTPSRAGLLTGRYAVRSGMINAIGPGAKATLPASEITLAEALKGLGYRTGMVGKWHLGDRDESNPVNHGFDYFFGLPYSNDYMPPFVAGTPPVPLLRGLEVIERPAVQPTLTTRYTEEAVAFIRASREAPFFLYIAHNMPHLPLAVSDSRRGRSRGGLYGDVIEEIDWSVGQVLNTLKALGLDGRTMTLFTSDNGPWLNAPPRMMQAGVERWDVGSAGALRDSKASTYEGGFRVPGIVRWPGRIPAGQVSADMASSLDVFPTVLRAAGAAIPSDRPMDGHDITALLTGRGPSATQEFFYFSASTLHAVRAGKWKFRLAPAEPAAVAELYDLDVDPSERYNVADRHPRIVKRLRARLETFGPTRSALRGSTRPLTTEAEDPVRIVRAHALRRRPDRIAGAQRR